MERKLLAAKQPLWSSTLCQAPRGALAGEGWCLCRGARGEGGGGEGGGRAGWLWICGLVSPGPGCEHTSTPPYGLWDLRGGRLYVLVSALSMGVMAAAPQRGTEDSDDGGDGQGGRLLAQWGLADPCGLGKDSPFLFSHFWALPPLRLPGSFPTPVLPVVSQWKDMMGTAFSLAIVGYVINLAMGRTLASKHGYDVDSNQVGLATASEAKQEGQVPQGPGEKYHAALRAVVREVPTSEEGL